MPRYFFDITATVWHLKRMSYFSGIQRTVVMMIDRAARLIGAENLHLSYFDRASRRYLTFPFAALATGDLIDAEQLRQRLGFRPLSQGLHPSLRGYAGRPLKRLFHQTAGWINLFAGRDRYFIRRNTTRQEWLDFHRRRRPRMAALPTVGFEDVARAGDQLILLDGTFTVTRAAEAFRAARRAGLKVSMMIHDLIPLAAPRLVPGINRLTFHDWLRDSESYTTGYLTNSEATRRDLDKFLKTYGIDRPVSVIRLAQARLPGRAAAGARPLLNRLDRTAYPELAEPDVDARTLAITAFPYVLCVGTLEIRKNIWRLATAWDRLRQIESLNLPKLVFAGRPGWMKDDFDRLMSATGRVYGWVEVFESPSDGDLDCLYRNCLFLAMPSLYEGWGLPVGEALSYGKTAVVSNTSSLPEVGGDLVEYCDPASIDSTARACLRLIADPGHRIALEQKSAAARLRSGNDVAADLPAALQAG